jgi:hypothetical protein
MDNAVLSAPLVIILGLIAPILISVLKRAGTSTLLNQLIAVAVSFAFGLASVVIDHGGLHGVTLPVLLGWTTAAYAIAQLTYHTYFVETDINKALSALIWGAPAGSDATVTGGSNTAAKPGT